MYDWGQVNHTASWECSHNVWLKVKAIIVPSWVLRICHNWHIIKTRSDAMQNTEDIQVLKPVEQKAVFNEEELSVCILFYTKDYYFDRLFCFSSPVEEDCLNSRSHVTTKPKLVFWETNELYQINNRCDFPRMSATLNNKIISKTMQMSSLLCIRVPAIAHY